MSWQDATGWLVAFGLLIAVAYSAFDVYGGSTGPSAKEIPRERGEAPPREGTSRDARVSRIVDGDTIIVRSVNRSGEPAGNLRRVRYIGVDTPESVKQDAPVECFGKEAAAANRKLVEGRLVRLVSDREAFDKYGRALAYVYVDGRFVNGELVENGFARTIEIPPNTSKAVELNRLERVAIRTNKGLWGACDR
jgi:micrococcal nuclease